MSLRYFLFGKFSWAIKIAVFIYASRMGRYFLLTAVFAVTINCFCFVTDFAITCSSPDWSLNNEERCMLEQPLTNTFVLRFLARLFEEYESYTTHPGVGVGVHVTPWLRFCMQVLKYYMYCIETFYNPTKLSDLCRLSS